ncbi:MAG TPA: hypothetical protein DEH78_03285 [Solibacterales bacterium]|nr:hypothetical protein [Bryobacterales bacterium]
MCLLALQAIAQQTPPGSELQRAAEEFKAHSRSLGLRADSPVRARTNGSRPGPALHGRIFHNFRNDVLDAVPKEVRQAGGTRPFLRRNQFGFNLNGPLTIPKLYQGARRTFFSISYEGVRERIGRSYLRTVPTTIERTGDWAHVVDPAGNPLPIYDPKSTRPNPAYDPAQPVSLTNLQHLRDQFPTNRIPESRLDPIAQRALALYPQPNVAIGPFFRNNYFVFSPESNSANGVILRVDHNIGERHRINVNGSLSNGFAGPAKFFDTAADSSLPDRTFANRRGSVEHVFTISPQTVNSLSFEAATDSSEYISVKSDFAAQLGVATAGSDVFPWIRLGNYLDMGNPNPSAANTRNTYSISNGISTRRGKHNLRGSTSLVLFQVNSFVPQYPAGTFRFTPGLTSLPGINNTGHAFASFLLGLSDFAERSLVEQPSYFRRARWALAGRDQYEIKPGLTLAFAGNVEVHTPRTEKFDRQSTVDRSSLNPAYGRPGALRPATGGDRAFQPVTLWVEPSASLSWSPGNDPKRIFRLAWSRAYTSLPIYSAQFGTQGFNGYDTFFSPNVQLEPAVTFAAGMPPARRLPDLRPEAANDTVAEYIHPTDDVPTYNSASASFEWTLPAAMILTLGAGTSNGRNLFVSGNTVNLNAIHPDALAFRDQLNTESFRRSLRPYPQFLAFDLYSSYPGGRYRRDAGYMRLEKRTSSGLSLNASYEFSKQMDDYSGPYGRQDFFNSKNEWSLTAYNNPHRLSLNYVYELPIGANKPFFSFSDWRRVLVDGWALSGISSVTSGEPLAFRPQFNNTGLLISSLNVDSAPGVSARVDNPSPALWFNPAAFAQPADFTLGNASRTHPYLRNPISQNHDLSVSKRFVLAPDRTLEFNASGFNFVNHANWNDPDTVIGPASAPNVNAGRIIGSRGGRVIQLGLRLSF